MTDITKITNGSLIGADKVNGTTVYNRAGEKLGSVEEVMIDKVSGRACYAVMSFGGFLGMGHKHHPLPWAALDYDKKVGGFVVDLDKRTLENAPTLDADDDDFEWTPDYGRSVDKYYNVPSAWM